MKAVRIDRFGDPEVLSLEEIDIPALNEGEVLVKVAAAGVNPVDFKIREGAFPAVSEDKLPITLGRDVSGEITDANAAAIPLREGDEVFAYVGSGSGGYAEYTVVKVDEIAPKPTTVSHEEAAAVPLAGMTAWQGLFDHGGLEARQRVLIHGGAGGVGHFAIQFAKTAGAWVATTVSAEDKAFATELGADQVVDYKAEKFEEVVEPVDVVFDLVAGETRDRSFNVLKRGGILVSTLGEPDADRAREAGVRTAGYMTRPNGDQLARIGRLIDEGKVRVEIKQTFPISQTADAHRTLKEEHTRGKIVLRTDA